jgi:hypothetical protein
MSKRKPATTHTVSAVPALDLAPEAVTDLEPDRGAGRIAGGGRSSGPCKVEQIP